MTTPTIALVGGSTRPESVSERALRVVAGQLAARGCAVELLTARDLLLPLYDPVSLHRTPQARNLVSALASCDGLVLSTPTYHGGMSGLMKNALDYAEDLASATPSYLDGRAVGCIATGWSDHGAATAVADLRNSTQSLRAWTTPMGVPINALSRPDVFTDPRLLRRLDILTDQVVTMARARLATALPA
ncbi:putative NADPH-dependent FMN reductase [Actinokineospora spheciospongiae]|uniref:Putative NADPH-dependent FMN reductase n=1 Tax=Actinokineospora spheciospongiae TaxID=909613 RepID=W7IWB6_9PSEU|nr:NAD(P)H-dependent oxidoreductase [Actinokineospora spheciospongiae]EWC64613.1 putative NADPH-dependent FMN reductase [Actinokineospora spheciospongiae]